MEFTKINEIDLSKIKFSRTKNSSGFRFISAFYNKKSIGLKFPSLRIPFDSKVNKYNQLEINVSLDKNEELINKITDLDNQMKLFAVENKWFNSNVEYDYTPMLKKSNSDYPPSIKMKIPIKDSVISTTFYDENKKKITVDNYNDVEDLMTKGTNIQSAIQCVGVWFNDDKFGLSWKAEQIRIMSKPEIKQESNNNQEDYAFCSDSEEDENSDVDLLIDDDE